MKLSDRQVTRAVIQRYARLLDRYGGEWGKRPFVLPNPDYFPDEFLGDPDSAVLLAARMQEHAGLHDIPIDCRVVSPGQSSPPQASSCSSGACAAPQTTGSGVARLVDNGDAWVLQVPAPELRHPVALTTNLARSLAYVFLVETKREGETLEPPVDVTADLVAVGLGFGTLMLQGSYIYAKSCGGPQIASVTKVGVAELAVATALFAHLGGHDLRSADKWLDVTQKAALTEAGRLMKANKKLIARMHSAPARVAVESFDLQQPGDFIASLKRKFSSSKSAQSPGDLDPDMAIEELESLLIDMPPSSQAGHKRPQTNPGAKSDDLAELVADALGEGRARA